MNRKGFLLALLVLAAGCGPDVPLSRPQWSPRGDRAAFVRYTPDGHALYIIDPAKAPMPTDDISRPSPVSPALKTLLAKTGISS